MTMNSGTSRLPEDRIPVLTSDSMITTKAKPKTEVGTPLATAGIAVTVVWLAVVMGATSGLAACAGTELNRSSRGWNWW